MSAPLSARLGTPSGRGRPRSANEVGRLTRVRPALGITAGKRGGLFYCAKTCVQFTRAIFANNVQGDNVMRMRLLCTALLVIVGTASFAVGRTSQPAAAPPTSDVSQFVKAGVTRVLVRYEWQWDRGAVGGGIWLAEQGVVTGVGPNWIVLSTDNTNKTLLIPFSAFRHLEFLN
jgi:hypothetical protein